MMCDKKIFKILHMPHVSEKVSTLMEKNNTVVLKVSSKTSKKDIVLAVNKLFEVKVNKVCTMIIKGKIKHHGKHVGRRRNWKKAYITLKKGQNLDFLKII